MALDPMAVTSLLAQIGAIALGTFLVGQILGSVVGKALSRKGSLAANDAHKLVKVSAWLAGFAFATEYFGLRVDVLLILIALSGGAALIANQSALQNIAARYFSDAYLQFRIGDRIRVGEYSGKIVEMNSITTMLVTDSEEVVSIPNSLLMREVVVNATPFAGRDITLPITIDNSVDLPTFERSLLVKCNKLRLHLDERLPPRIGIRQKTDKSTQLELMVRMRNPEYRERIVRELDSRIHDTLLEFSKKKEKTNEQPAKDPILQAPLGTNSN